MIATGRRPRRQRRNLPPGGIESRGAVAVGGGRRRPSERPRHRSRARAHEPFGPRAHRAVAPVGARGQVLAAHADADHDTAPARRVVLRGAPDRAVDAAGADREAVRVGEAPAPRVAQPPGPGGRREERGREVEVARALACRARDAHDVRARDAQRLATDPEEPRLGGDRVVAELQRRARPEPVGPVLRLDASPVHRDADDLVAAGRRADRARHIDRPLGGRAPVTWSADAHEVSGRRAGRRAVGPAAAAAEKRAREHEEAAGGD